ncbi:MAG: NBR1-Ig-like domain-containing protein [Chloroflexota bacterium]|nr:NBR1-Ig-like domain-containing protein [Chloroflexota bacterium]
MLKFRLMTGVQSLVIISTLLLAACGATPAEFTPTPNVNVDEIKTQAVGTFAADLTLTAAAAPSNTPVATLTPAPTFPALATSTAGTPFVSGPTVAPTTGCYGLAFVSDVTIPDNTAVTVGQTFTKTWKVRNAGSCAWDTGFKFAFVSGDAMGGTTQTLAASVAAGAEFNISVPMTAPNKSGAVQGYWRMSTAAGQFFGDQVYVLVSIGGGTGATATSTTSLGPTSTTGAPTSTATLGTPATP